MANVEEKKAIESSIKSFKSGQLREQSKALLNSLGYVSDLTLKFAGDGKKDFLQSFDPENRFRKEKALFDEWAKIELIFQITTEQISKQSGLFTTPSLNKSLEKSYLFFAVELKKDSIARGTLAQITREVNRLMPQPTFILFHYGNLLSLAIIDRRPHKREDSKDVLEKVTLIKDISIASPHRAHIEILFDLSLPQLIDQYAVQNWEELHNAWRKTLNISELNKKFYRQIANWYFWAVKSVKFPMAPGIETEEENNSINVIRLLTRLIFVWFLKEKNLVPDDLFDTGKLSKILKDFDSSSKKKSNYYRAILQNLFFGTLNQKMNSKKESNNRRFRSDDRDSQNRADDYNVTNVYRYKDQFRSTKEALDLFSAIPFLNGGLFDCLDRQDEKDPKKVIRIDGFSDNPKYQSSAPDVLFFGDEDDIDLSKVYDDRKRSHEQVKGLIHILNDYKFTIAENTPIEEEIALDPELLGRIFENLLAAYNPETGTTARKATGSFYTPREIVNYMVDESLIAYLKTKMLQENPAVLELGSEQTDAFGNKARKDQLRLERPIEINKWVNKPDILETEVRNLLSYSDAKISFDEQDKDRLITAINNLKVLDPACGSGAFPMGVLLKVVHVLHKLDPANNKWKQVQLKVAEQMPDSTVRREMMERIEESFSSETNYGDYGRKLFLIENCIYGIDIQPIAVQIAKLRFFISLLVDQKHNDSKDNRGVLSLPNLETKFVAANTLIGIQEALQQSMIDQDVRSLEKELREVRGKYFTAQNRRQKIQLKEKDKSLRIKLSELIQKKHDQVEQIIQKNIEDLETHLEKNKKELSSKGMLEGPRKKLEKANEELLKQVDSYKMKLLSGSIVEGEAKKLSDWDPYDQNVHAGFFDKEWMFGLSEGFGIVIGNPPYGLINKKQNKAETIFVTDNEYDYYKNSAEYKPASKGMINIYRLFIIKSYYLLREKGVFSQIFPLAFIGDTSASSLRSYLFDNSTLSFIEAFPERDNENKRVFEASKMSVCVLHFLKTKSNMNFFIRIHSDRFVDEENEKAYLNHKIIKLLDRDTLSIPLLAQSELDLIAKIYKNSRRIGDIGHCYTGEVDLTLSKRFLSDNKNDTILLKGAILGKYVIRDKMSQGDIKYLKEKEFLKKMGGKAAESFKKERIALQGITGVNEYTRLKMTLVPKDLFLANSANYIILNESSIDNKFVLGVLNSSLLNYIFKKFSTNSNVNGYEVDNLPIPNSISTEEQSNIVDIVIRILSLKKKNPTADTDKLEREIDLLVYKLYGLTDEEVNIVEGK